MSGDLIAPRGEDQSCGPTETNDESLHAAIKPMCSDGIEKADECVAPPLGEICGPTAVPTWASLQRPFVTYVSSISMMNGPPER
jgi:hypothetical protein